MGVHAHLSENHPYFKFVAYESERFFQNIFVGLFVGVLTSTFLTIYLSHRLAGPIVRMKKYFETISKVDEPIHPLKFRKMDFFSDLAPIVNRSIEVIQKRSRHR
jgi:hypothetical protein